MDDFFEAADLWDADEWLPDPDSEPDPDEESSSEPESDELPEEESVTSKTTFYNDQPRNSFKNNTSLLTKLLSIAYKFSYGSNKNKAKL